MKYVLGILSALLIFFSIVLLVEEDEPLIITTSEKVYSFKQTTKTEVFHISLLATRLDPYYFNKECITSISLRNQEEKVPLTLKDIKMSETTDNHYLIDFSLQIAFEANDYFIMFEEAQLEINYTNNETFLFDIGEFNYIFNQSTHQLTYNQISGTYGYIASKNTVTALIIELENNSDTNIVIKDIDVFSKTVNIHQGHIFELPHEIDMFASVEDVLKTAYFAHDIDQTELSLFMQTKESKTIYCPLLYNGDIHYIHRFVIMITYIENNQEKTLVIDDFPFMKTSHFSSEYEEGYHIYEID